jgi:hypothetical protein
MEAISRPKFRTLTPAEAKAMMAHPSRKGNKEAFLQAIVGTMTKEEAEEMERVINASCERVDD